MITPEPIDDEYSDGVIVAGPNNNLPFPSKLYNMLEHVRVWLFPRDVNVEVNSGDSGMNQDGVVERFFEMTRGRRQLNLGGSQRVAVSTDQDPRNDQLRAPDEQDIENQRQAPNIEDQHPDAPPCRWLWETFDNDYFYYYGMGLMILYIGSNFAWSLYIMIDKCFQKDGPEVIKYLTVPAFVGMAALIIPIGACVVKGLLGPVPDPQERPFTGRNHGRFIFALRVLLLAIGWTILNVAYMAQPHRCPTTPPTQGPAQPPTRTPTQLI